MKYINCEKNPKLGLEILVKAIISAEFNEMIYYNEKKSLIFDMNRDAELSMVLRDKKSLDKETMEELNKISKDKDWKKVPLLKTFGTWEIFLDLEGLPPTTRETELKGIYKSLWEARKMEEAYLITGGLFRRNKIFESI